jgi:hypothetical protein
LASNATRVGLSNRCRFDFCVRALGQCDRRDLVKSRFWRRSLLQMRTKKSGECHTESQLLCHG